MPHSESDKASRYLTQLDEARCSGRWSDVVELARKVRKHASHRECLIVTAETEAKIAAYSQRRPGTAASAATTSSQDLSKYIPDLLTFVNGETAHKQDAFQASICLGWLHSVLGEPGLAVGKFPKDFRSAYTQVEGEAPLFGWTKVCLVKGAYLKGMAQEKSTAEVSSALETYNTVVPYIGSFSEGLTGTPPEFQQWAEALLGRVCVLADQTLPSGPNIPSGAALASFRLWTKLFASRSNSASAHAPSRRHVLKAYYDSLSIILQQDSEYTPPESTGSTVTADETYNRLQQRAEVKRVETMLETELLKETTFPKASESNREVEKWVDDAISNWRIFCGSTWTDDELGQGGKPAVAREVLDLLYRAATKTFHSTQILRYLFIVHASLAEFDLAFKAFDAYVELVTRSKARTAKSGEENVDLDDDDTIIRTAAEAIRILCRFGSKAEAAKACRVSETMQAWLSQEQPAPASTSQTISHSRNSTAESIKISTESKLSPRARAVAFRAIGLSQAQWARFTFDASSRSRLQTEAIKSLKKSLDPAFEDVHNIEGHYALALVLAEIRDITGAVRVVKKALAEPDDTQINADGVISADDGFASGEFARERKLIPLWHLLALLLTARSEPQTAAKACEAAFEQFEDDEILFGSGHAHQSTHLNGLAATEKSASVTKGLVDFMESYEKESILQIKITQLALIETLEGSNVAVDSCNELVALFGRLFPEAQQVNTNQVPQTAKSGKSTTGTVRGGFFHRHRLSEATFQKPVDANSAASAETTAATNGSTIARSVIGSRLHKHNSLGRKSIDNTALANGPAGQDGQSHTGGPGKQSIDGRPDQPLGKIHHNMDKSELPPPTVQLQQPPKQDLRLPAPLPRYDALPQGPRFPAVQESRHRASLLSSIWLFISELYSRAGLYNDAKEAVAEAANLVQRFEAEITVNSTSSMATSEKKWGGGKSLDELWADIWAARGATAQACDQPHEALHHFERALAHFPDHAAAIVGLSSILLDIYSQKIPQEAPRSTGMLTPSLSTGTASKQGSAEPKEVKANDFHRPQALLQAPSAANKASPTELNRLAARDRAYGLLSSLTKLGSGWDYSEAWYTLARAYEEGEQIEKAKEVLWWCVELEDAKPLRHWSVVGNGGTVV